MGVLELLGAELSNARMLADEFAGAYRDKDLALAGESRDALCTAVAHHIEVEEEILHPVLRRHGGELTELVETAAGQHAEASALVQRAQQMDAADPELADLVRRLGELVAQHHEQAERELAPVLRRTLPGELAVLGRRYADVRRNVREDAMFPQLLSALLGPESCCLDIGSNRGVVLQDMVRFAPEGRHVAYEPVPSLALDLRQRFPQVDVRQAAVSDQNGTTTFAHVTVDAAYSSLHDRGGSARGWPEHVGAPQVEQIVVRTESLDSALPAGWSPDLIKIDVEGAEGLVLAGAAELLATHRPVVVVEHLGTGLAGGHDTTSVWDILVTKAGLRVYDFHGRGPYTKDEFVRSAQRLAATNYLVRP